MSNLIPGIINGVGDVVGGVVEAVLPTQRYLVTMTSAFALPDGGIATHKATDYVAKGDLDAYVTDARTRWQVVTVADQPTNMSGAYDVTAAQTAPKEG